VYLKYLSKRLSNVLIMALYWLSFASELEKSLAEQKKEKQG